MIVYYKALIAYFVSRIGRCIIICVLNPEQLLISLSISKLIHLHQLAWQRLKGKEKEKDAQTGRHWNLHICRGKIITFHNIFGNTERGIR